MVSVERLELPTPCSQSTCATSCATPRKRYGLPEQLSLVREPTHHCAIPKAKMVEVAGLEPATICLQSRRSPN